MILLWVMSLLLYLAWTVAQLESMLALEIQSQAIQVRYQSEFEKAEALLAHCEDRLRTLLIHKADSAEIDFNSLDLLIGIDGSHRAFQFDLDGWSTPNTGPVL
ncbi:MAG: hypothetical protein EBV46_06520 [Burkholderiaceae bacterium]|nr:hypothetical protein [Burkholderiaceae bacterium]